MYVLVQIDVGAEIKHVCFESEACKFKVLLVACPFEMPLDA